MSGTFASYPIQGSGGGGGSGTVTSVGLNDGSSTPIYIISGSPVTTSGTLTFTLATQTANKIFASATSGGAAQPAFRALVAADLPTGNLTDVGTDGIVVTGGTGAVVGSGTSIAQHVADSTHNGYLSSTDWTTFNNKQSALTIGNLTDAGTDGITVTSGTGAVIGSGTSIAQHVADSTHNGYLSSTDWSTFNNKGSGSVTSVAVSGGTTGLTTSGGPITTSGTITLAGTLVVANGGTGQTSYTDGQLLIGNTATGGLSKSTLTAGSNITITNGNGTISIAATGGGGSGTVTSVDVSGGTTGLTTSGGPITSSGTITLAGTLAKTNGGTGVTSTPTTASASNFAAWDASVNLPANNHLQGYTTTAGSGGTVTLTVASSQYQAFTGTGGKTIKLPVTSTLVLGHTFTIFNQTGDASNLTIQSSGANAIGNVLSYGALQTYTCILTSGTNNASWSYTQNISNQSGNGSGAGAVALFADAAGMSIYSSGMTISNSASASTIVQRDAQQNIASRNFIPNYTTVATAAGTTTLTNASNYYQLFTGVTTQTVVLPVTSTLSTGWTFAIYNNSTGAVTINSSGANAVQVLAANSMAYITCILASGTTAASWQSNYMPLSATITGTGNQVLATSPTFVTPVLGTPTSGNLSNCTSYPAATSSVAGTVTFEATGTTASTFTFDNSGGSSGSININYCRVGPIVSVYFASNPIATSGTASVTFKSDTAIPAAYRPTTQQWLLVPVQITATNQTVSGMMSINTDGTFTLYSNAVGTAWTTAQANSGYAEVVNITYYRG